MTGPTNNPVPDDFVRMLAAGPGKYAIPMDAAIRVYLLVEVDEKGQVHQLKPDGVTRDGVLSMGGWVVKPGFQVKVFHYEKNAEGKTVFRRVGTKGMNLPERKLPKP